MEVVNTANAMEADLALTGEGCKLGLDPGRMAYQVGRIPAETYSASPHEGVPEATPERLINASVVAA
jgi:thiazole synthase ThiGH ThiG subunit